MLNLRKCVIYLLFFGMAFDVFLLLPRDFVSFESTRYMLSALAQSEAAIIGLIITLSLIAAQLAAASYSIRLIRIFIESYDFLFMVSIYIFSIAFNLFILQWYEVLNFNWLFINSAYILGIFCFLSIIPYVWNTMNILDPLALVNHFNKKITKVNLSKVDEDPFFPVRSILTKAVRSDDFELISKGLGSLKERLKYVIVTEFQASVTDAYPIDKMYSNLEGLFYISWDLRNRLAMEKIFDIFKELGMLSRRKHESVFIGRHAMRKLYILGQQEDPQSYWVTIRAINILGKIGKSYVDNHLIDLVNDAQNNLFELGFHPDNNIRNSAIGQLISIKKESKKISEAPWVRLVGEIDKKIKKLEQSFKMET